VGGLQGAGLVGVAVAQFLEVVAGAGDGLFFVRAVDVVVVSLYAGVGIAVGLQKAVLVAVRPGEGDVRQGQAAGGSGLAGGQEQQPAGLDGCDGVTLTAKAAEQVGV